MEKKFYPSPGGILTPAGATAAEWSEQWFGGPTRMTQSSPTVNTTTAVILKGNPKRVFWLVQNAAALDMNIAQKAITNLAESIVVAAQGGFASMAVQEDGEAVAYEVWAISAITPATLFIVEIERV